MLEAHVKGCYSFTELCRRLGLKPEGSNSKTLRKKMDEFGVDYSHFKENKCECCGISEWQGKPIIREYIILIEILQIIE